ncbi:MAG: hypothetical protein P4L11_00875 [Geothrix sp.]|nr:hypothetical protein [Geothrix sp.]
MVRPQRSENNQDAHQATWFVYLIRCGDDGAPSTRPVAEWECRAGRGTIGG